MKSSQHASTNTVILYMHTAGLVVFVSLKRWVFVDIHLWPLKKNYVLESVLLRIVIKQFWIPVCTENGLPPVLGWAGPVPSLFGYTPHPLSVSLFAMCLCTCMCTCVCGCRRPGLCKNVCMPVWVYVYMWVCMIELVWVCLYNAYIICLCICVCFKWKCGLWGLGSVSNVCVKSPEVTD